MQARRLVYSLPRHHDHLFFPAMALLLLATVFVGFAPTCYLAGLACFAAWFAAWIRSIS